MSGFIVTATRDFDLVNHAAEWKELGAKRLLTEMAVQWNQALPQIRARMKLNPPKTALEGRLRTERNSEL